MWGAGRFVPVCQYQHDPIVLTVGDTAGPRGSPELPLEPGSAAFAGAVLKADVETVQGVQSLQ